MDDTTQPAVEQALQQASEGLLFPSETDAPLVPFFWPSDDSAAIDSALVAKLAGVAADATVKTGKLETFFRPAVKEEEWHNEEEKAEVLKFQALLKVIKSNLSDVKVFRVGDTKVDVYIVGKVDGGYAGLQTKVVET